jgi:hypothetical protein
MKRSICALMMFGIALNSNVAAATAAPADVIRSFYKWYVSKLLANEDPLTKNRGELKKFVTQRFLSEIDRMQKGPDGLDGDPFVDAQDFDKDWASKISVTSTKIEGERASCDVVLTGREVGTKKLKINLAESAGSWKIDKVVGSN